ncbi:MAG: VWA domain-containing protein [Bacteroidales bacterium]|nr:VWA domain-containing protein [Bacteroidales bacterium]
MSNYLVHYPNSPKRLVIINEMNRIKNILVLLGLLMLTWPVGAQKHEVNNENQEKTRILFVFDASQSMYGRWNYQQKIFAARNILADFMDSIASVDNVEVALRVFGDKYHVPPQVCEDSRLVVPFARDNTRKIKKALREIVPKGTTPISYALEQAANDFPDCKNCRNIIVLITDGIEECGGDPCEVSLKLQQKGIILKPFVIGIGKDFKNAYDCVGTFIQATSEEQFVSALNIMITQAMNNSTAQINLLDASHNPTTTNVTVSIYDRETNILKYNFIHTLNGFGVPDTLYLDPRMIYRVVAHTIPPVIVDSVVVKSAQHNTIALDAPIGSLSLELKSRDNVVNGLQAIIRESGKNETLNVQQFGQQEKYITSYYQVEVLSIPRLIIDSVLISPNHTTKVEIPGPGILVVKKPGLGYGSIFKETQDGLEWVYRFRDNINHIESLYLLPGEYIISYRTKFSNTTSSSMDRQFVIKTGETVTVDLN